MPTTSLMSIFIPKDRDLPNRSVTLESISEAYAAFILYCNPSYPVDVDTAALKSAFKSLPKSDGKDFDIYQLFELISKLDRKVIKTWNQLALDLGVEAPDVSKGQSSQKVQQYTVRLKRWMRAMHVDAFFEYLLGNSHSYFTDVPHPDDPYPSNGRDGVPTEEDLAIRALDPRFRPKRGRRRNSEIEDDVTVEGYNEENPSKTGDHESVEAPWSAHPGSHSSYDARLALTPSPWALKSSAAPQRFARWSSGFADAPQSAVAMTVPSELQWGLHDNSTDSGIPYPATAHPRSMGAYAEHPSEHEPQSATTPSAKKRRKHGPAVSSAWPVASGARPRGRPPADRDVRNGPHRMSSTGRARLADEAGWSAPAASMTAGLSGEVVEEDGGPAEVQTTSADPTYQSVGSARPSKLSLQVPQHIGGEVGLATPSTVLVKGHEKPGAFPANEHPYHSSSLLKSTIRSRESAESEHREVSGFAFEALKRVLASDLLRAEVAGRRHRLTGEEAKRLADAVLERLNVPRNDTEASKDDIARLTAASWLGVGEQLNVPLGPAVGQQKRIAVTRFRRDDEGYEEVVAESDDDVEDTREVFDLFWTVSMGGCKGTFELRELSLGIERPRQIDVHDLMLETWAKTAIEVGMSQSSMDHVRQVFQALPPDNHRDGFGDDGIDWKARAKALEFAGKLAKGEFDRFRQRTIEKVLDAIM